MQVSFDRSKGGSVLDRVREVFGRTKDLTPMIEPVRAVLEEANRVRALAGVDYTGEPYAPLRPSTIEDRRSKGFSIKPPLVRQGIYSRVIQGCRIDVLPEVGRLRVFKGWPGVPWMEYHIMGTARMPRRDPMGWGNEIDAVRDMLPNHVFNRTFIR